MADDDENDSYYISVARLHMLLRFTLEEKIGTNLILIMLKCDQYLLKRIY